MHLVSSLAAAFFRAQRQDNAFSFREQKGTALAYAGYGELCYVPGTVLQMSQTRDPSSWLPHGTPRKRNFANMPPKKRARTAGSIPQRLCGHAVTAMGGKIYITGGYNTTEGR